MFNEVRVIWKIKMYFRIIKIWTINNKIIIIMRINNKLSQAMSRLD